MKRLSRRDRQSKIDYIVHVLGTVFPNNPNYRYAHLEAESVSDQYIEDTYARAVEVLSEKGSLE